MSLPEKVYHESMKHRVDITDQYLAALANAYAEATTTYAEKYEAEARKKKRNKKKGK